MSDTPLIIDDGAAACRRLTALGRAVVGPACDGVRAAIREFANLKGWMFASYDKFAEWALQQLPSGEHALCFDPLLQVNANSRRIRVSRVMRGDTWCIEHDKNLPLAEPNLGSSVTLMDDAVASGSTLRHVGALVEARGGRIGRIVVCASTSMARTALGERFPGVKWHQFVDRGCFTIHLRDACPYAPFSGRPHAKHPPIETDTGRVLVRIPSITIRQSLWGHVFADYRVLAATVRARNEVCARLSAELGRDATVADLRLLGDDVALPAYPRHELSASTTLASIC